MSVFGMYSQYYDLLYADKDYNGEAAYVDSLVKRFGINAHSILELGCGTGKHAMLLAEKGYTVTGVDMSKDMLGVAENRVMGTPVESKIDFMQGDVRSVRIEKKYDAVISLFHVMSYQTTNKDLQNAFETAAIHLNPNGILIFDCWYGPAVLTDKPVVRMKQLEDDFVKVLRIAEPVMHPNDNIVDVKYTVIIKEKATNRFEEIEETHKMRYLFKPEIDFLLIESGLKILHAEEWMTGNEPRDNTWGVTFVVNRECEL